MWRQRVLLCAAVALLARTGQGRELQQSGDCTQFSNVYNCFVSGVQMGSVCINQCTNPRNPLFCQDCEDARARCAAAVPAFDVETSTIHLGQGTSTERCPEESPDMQSLGILPTHAGEAAAAPPPIVDVCAMMSYQYDCMVGTARIGTVCVPLCPNSMGSPPCIPCEDVRANCAWAYPGFRATHFSTFLTASRNMGCY